MKSAAIALSDLPIPLDVKPTARWTSQMLEMAAHIGPYATLLFVEAFGGQYIYIPEDASRNRAAPVIGEEAARILSRIYSCNRLQVPTAKNALAEARRGGVIAAIRSGAMTIQAAVPILGTSRTYLSHLVNHTDEGTDRPPMALPNRPADPRQIELFDIGETE